MLILNLDFCDCFFLSRGTSTDYPNYLEINFEKNEEFITDMTFKLQNQFLKKLFPEVVTHKNEICANKKQILLLSLKTIF